MSEDYESNLKRFLEESDSIGEYLAQQIRQGSISQVLYVEKIKRFLAAKENFKSILKMESK